MIYLVTILTTNNIDLLTLSIMSALNQLYTNYHLYIIVNTLNDTYLEEVINLCKNKFPNKIERIIRTESNGRPGKGHNSLIKIFNESDYDYLIMCDGDDFLYPTALLRINNLIVKNNYDLIALIGNPSKIITSPYNIQEQSSLSERRHILTKEITIEKKNLNINNISTDYNTILATPCRLVFINKTLSKKYTNLYDEGMYVYDDYRAFLKIYEDYVQQTHSICFLNDAYIYMYNGFNSNSVSKSNSNVGKLADHEIFKSYNINKLDVSKINIILNNEFSTIEWENIDSFERTIMNLYRIYHEKQI